MRPSLFLKKWLGARVILFYSLLILVVIAVVITAAARYSSARMVEGITGSIGHSASKISDRFDDDIAQVASLYAVEQLLLESRPHQPLFVLPAEAQGVMPLKVYTQLDLTVKLSGLIKSLYVYSYVNDTLVSSQGGVYFGLTKPGNPYARYFDLARFEQARDPNGAPWGNYDIFDRAQSVPSYRQTLYIQGKPAGVLVVNVSPGLYREMIEPVVHDIGGRLVILSDTGEALYAEPGADIPHGALSREELVRPGLKRVKTGSGEIMAAWAPSKRGDWAYAVIVPLNVFLRPVNEFYAMISAVAVALVLMSLLSAVLVGARLFRPFNTLVSRIVRVGNDEEGEGDVETITWAIRRVTHELEDAREALSADTAMQEQKFLFGVITDQMASPADADTRMKSLFMRFEYPWHVLFVVRFSVRQVKALGAANIEGFLSVSVDLVKRFFAGGQCTVMGAPVSHDAVLCLVNAADPGEVTARIEPLLGHLQQMLGARLNIAVASPVSSLTQLTQSYTAASSAMEYAFLYPAGQVFTPDRVSGRAHSMISLETIAEIEAHMRAGRAADVQRLVRDHIDKCRRECATWESASIAINTVINALMRVSASMGVDLNQPERRAFAEGLLRADTADDYLEWIGDLMSVISLVADGQRGAMQVGYIERIRNHIVEHIEEDVTQKAVAEAFGISSGHLSRLFKECTGEHYQSFVTATKLERAMRLLAETDLNVADIASRLGYYQPAYFNRIFKERTGATPGQYRKLNRDGDWAASNPAPHLGAMFNARSEHKNTL